MKTPERSQTSDVVLVILLLTLYNLTYFYSVSIGDFKQVKACWDVKPV